MRAPAFDRRGVPKVVALHTVQLGKDRPVLRWQAQEAKPLPVGQQSKVVRVACIKQFVAEIVWRERSKNISGAAKSWLATLRIPKEDIVDIFAPRKSECGTILSVNVRMVAARAAEIEMASGIAGFLSRELPSDSKAIQPSGHIKWCKKKEDETGPEMLKRARGEAELSSPCLGLAYSNSGTIGVRTANGGCETAWKVTGLPKNTSISQFAEWMKLMCWPEIALHSIRKRVNPNGASFVFRGSNPSGANSATTVQTVADGKEVFVEFEPFRPPVRPKVFESLKDSGLSWDEVKADAASSPGVQKCDVIEKDAISMKKVRLNEEGDSSMGVHKEEVLQNLGLTVRCVPTDGACFFHALSWWFEKSGKAMSCPQALRAQTIDHLAKKRDIFEPLWDRQTPKGESCTSWKAYLDIMADAKSWAGELEALAAAARWNLKIMIVRPGASTIVVGQGKAHIWILLRNSHFEPLEVDGDPAHSQVRKDHIAKVADCFKLMTQQVVQRSWVLRGGGKLASDSSGRHSRGASPRARLGTNDALAVGGPGAVRRGSSISLQVASAGKSDVSGTLRAGSAGPTSSSHLSGTMRNRCQGRREPSSASGTLKANSTRPAGLSPRIHVANPSGVCARSVASAPVFSNLQASGTMVAVQRKRVSPIAVVRGNASQVAAACLAANKLAEAQLSKRGIDCSNNQLKSKNLMMMARALKTRKRLAGASEVNNAWNVVSIDAAAKLRGAALSLPWLCAPMLLNDGVKCTRCPRQWFGSKKHTAPSRFCRNTPCVVCAVQVPPQAARDVILSQLGLLKERTTSDLDSVKRRAEALGTCVQEARLSKFSNWSCPLCSYLLPEATFDPAYVTRQHLRAHGAAGRAELRRSSSALSSAHKSAFIAMSKANVNKRLATFKADAEARHEMLNDALPGWVCRFELDEDVPGRCRSKGPFTCSRCEHPVCNKFWALRCARICPKAEIAAQVCAEKMSVAARREAIEACINQSIVLDAERRSQRKREKLKLLTTLRRRKFVAGGDGSGQASLFDEHGLGRKNRRSSSAQH